jgi:hypothetical protein
MPSTLSWNFGERTRVMPATWLSDHICSSSAWTFGAMLRIWKLSPVAIVPAASVAPIAVPV